MKIDYYHEIKKRYGNIKRARGYYLYTEKSVRLIDMYLDGGNTIAGRLIGQSKLILKQKTDKGLWLCLPTQAEHQLKKVLKTFFPKHSEVRIYKSEETTFDIASQIMQSQTNEEMLWRFCADNHKDYLLEKPCFVIKPPFPCNYGIIVFNPEKITTTPKKSDPIFAAELFTIVRSFYDIKYATKKINSNLAINVPDEIQKVWNRQGIYLTPKTSAEKYTELFIKALDAHIFISPNFEEPSIFPLLKSYSELNKFLKSL